MKNKKQNERPAATTPSPASTNFAETMNFKNAQTSSKGNSEALPFSKGNYTIMLVGLAVIIAGFFIMTMDKEDFGFGFMGITLGPIIAFIGFVIEFYAILKK
jgi:Protein of unknown function (DUF3098)